MKVRPAPAMLSFVLLCASARAADIEIGGRAVGPGGRPVQDVEVSLLRAVEPVSSARMELGGRLGEPVARGKTGADGFFDLAAPEPGLYTLRLAAPGFVPAIHPLLPLLESLELPDAELAMDGGLTIRVTGPDGRPVSGATVRVAEPRPRFGREVAGWKAATRLGTTGEDGTLRVPRADAESSIVTVGAPGFLVQERRSLHGTSATFRLERGVRSPIEARSADGEPVEGALVAAVDTDHPLGFTDAAGGLVLAVPTRTGLRVEVSTPDGRRVQGVVLPPAPESKTPRRFKLPAAQGIAGRVIDAQTRGAIAGAWVYPAQEPWAAVATDGNGAYALTISKNVRVEVAAGATGYLPPDPIEAIAGSTDAAGPTLALRPAAAIEGTVVDTAGNAVSGAKIRLEEKRSGNQIRIVVGGGPRLPGATASSRGRFRLSGIDPTKAYDLEARAAGYAPGGQEILGLKPRKTVQGLRIELDRGQRVVGRVVDGEGRPVPEAEASLKVAPRNRGLGGMVIQGEGSPQDPVKATTDAEGRFVLSGLPAGTFDGAFHRKGFARKVARGIEVKKGPEPIDLGDVALERGERLVGSVADPDGRPIDGAQISIGDGSQPAFAFLGGGSRNEPPDAVTGPDGWFAVEDLRAGDPVQVTASRKGYVDGKQTGVSVPSSEPLQVTLRPSSKVSGIVVDRDKKPIPGASVSLTRTQTGGIGGAVMRMVRRESATADDGGKFLFEGVEPGTISLSATAPSWQEAKLDAVEVPNGDDLEGIEILLQPGAVVTGRVLAPDGRPAIGAEVSLVGEEDAPVRFGGPGTDGDGRYRLEGIEPGKVSIEATHPDYVRTAKDLDARPGTNVLNLQLEGGNEVTGVLVDATGAPVAGGFVRLGPKGSDWGGPDTTSGVDGAFRLTGVADGDYSISAGKKGFGSSSGTISVKVEGQPVRDLRVELPSGGAIVGSVSGLDPEMLPQVVVRAIGPDASGFGGTSVDRQGRYRLDDLSPGTWTVIASVESSGEQARGEVALEAGMREAALDLQFGRGLTLSGRAMHADAPVQNAMLFVQGMDVNHSGSGRTGSNGKFAIKGLEPGTYRLDLRQWDSGLTYSQTVEVKESRDITLEIPSAVASGVVVDAADRQPLAGVALALSQATSDADPRPSFLSERSATTDANGRFRVADLADGEWRLSMSRKGYAAETQTLQIQNGRGPDDLRLDLDPTEGLTLEVHLPSGRVPEEVSAVVLDPAGRPLTRGRFATGENGKVRLSSVPAGSWEILVSAGGSGTASVQAAAPGGPLPVFLPPACGLKVSVPDLGGTDVAATATIQGADGKPFRELAWFSDPISTWRLRKGQVELDTMPPGSWTIQVSAADGRHWHGTAATAPGTPASVVLN